MNQDDWSRYTPAMQGWLRKVARQTDERVTDMMSRDPDTSLTPADYIALFNSPVIEGIRLAGVEFKHSPHVPEGLIYLMRREIPIPPIPIEWADPTPSLRHVDVVVWFEKTMRSGGI